MTIALSQFCIAFRRRSEAGRSGRHKCRENQYPHYNRSQPRHPDLPLWNAVPRRPFQRTARDASKHVRAIDAEILDQGPMHPLAPTVTIVRATCRSRSEDRNSEPTQSGDRHVTQIRTCDRCCRFAQRRQLDANARIRLAWRVARWWLGLGRWLGTGLERWLGSRLESWLGTRLGRPWMGMASRLGMGRTSLRCSPWILWRRMRRSSPCAGSVGSALGPGESLLVVITAGPYPLLSLRIE
jgi:hypothetical protein